MAIDTVNEKLALATLLQPHQPPLPISADGLGQDDKQHLLWGYPGILWEVLPPTSSTFAIIGEVPVPHGLACHFLFGHDADTPLQLELGTLEACLERVVVVLSVGLDPKTLDFSLRDAHGVDVLEGALVGVMDSGECTLVKSVSGVGLPIRLLGAHSLCITPSAAMTCSGTIDLYCTPGSVRRGEPLQRQQLWAASLLVNPTGDFAQVSIPWQCEADGTARLSLAKVGLSRFWGRVVRAVTVPSVNNPPTALYDLMLIDRTGRDMLYGGGANRSATVAETAWPTLAWGTYARLQPYTFSELTLTVNNAGNATSGQLVLYVELGG